MLAGYCELDWDIPVIRDKVEKNNLLGESRVITPTGIHRIKLITREVYSQARSPGCHVVNLGAGLWNNGLPKPRPRILSSLKGITSEERGKSHQRENVVESGSAEKTSQKDCISPSSRAAQRWL